jgi:putative effector of murein hydrolase LrgA (UPF0299 family)
VGVVLYLDLVAAEWPAIAAALVLSTLASMLVTAFVMRAFTRKDPRA